jgi:hypothetical protein
MATTLGITNTIDFTNEISKINDLHWNYKIWISTIIKTILDFWGSGVTLLQIIIYMVTIALTHWCTNYDFTWYYRPNCTIFWALALNIYTTTGANYVLYTLENRGHGPWDAIANGKSLNNFHSF